MRCLSPWYSPSYHAGIENKGLARADFEGLRKVKIYDDFLHVHTHTHAAQDLHFAEHILALKYLWALFDTLRTENITVCLC